MAGERQARIWPTEANAQKCDWRGRSVACRVR